MVSSVPYLLSPLQWWAMSEGPKILLAFDGTDQASHAIEYAARYLRAGIVELLTAWEPSARQAARSVTRVGVQPVGGSEDPAADPAYEEAQRVCNAGVQHAESLGLSARAHLVESATTISSAIIDAAHELDVDVIVTGTRALTGFRAWWTNSTADQIVRNAGLPVFIVPQENEDDADNDEAEYF